MKQYYYGEWYDEGTGPLCCAKFPHAAGLHWRDKPEAFKREIPGMVTQEEDKPAPAQDEQQPVVVPQCVRDWYDARASHVAAVDAYNARLAFVREYEPFGTSVNPEYQIMEAAERKARSLLGPMFTGLTEFFAARPAQTAPQCNHRFMYFGDQTKRRCADCCVVEGNEQTAPQPENKPGLGVNWRSVAGSQASVIERLQDQLSDRDKEQQELRDEIMQLKAQLDHVNAINSELLRGLKAIAFVGSNNELRLRSTHEVVSDHFGSKSLLCLGVKC